MSPAKKVIAALGRICFSFIFIMAGINKILHWDAMEQALVNAMLDVLSYHFDKAWIRSLIDALMPQASLLLLLATICEVVGGILIFLGFYVRLGALLIVLFLIPVTFFFHHFWLLEGSDRELQMIMFMKNLSIFGGALILLAFGKGVHREKTL